MLDLLHDVDTVDAHLMEEMRAHADRIAPFAGIVRCFAHRRGERVPGMAFRHPTTDIIQSSVFVADTARARFACGELGGGMLVRWTDLGSFEPATSSDEALVGLYLERQIGDNGMPVVPGRDCRVDPTAPRG